MAAGQVRGGLGVWELMVTGFCEGWGTGFCEGPWGQSCPEVGRGCCRVRSRVAGQFWGAPGGRRSSGAAARRGSAHAWA